MHTLALLSKSFGVFLSITIVNAMYRCTDNTDGNNVVQLATGDMCTCTAGYYISSRSSDDAASKWSCKACEAGYFKKEIGAQLCLPCATDYEWSAIGATQCSVCETSNMLTAETRHRNCVPCPVNILTLTTYINLRYIQNVAINLTPATSVMLSSQNAATVRRDFYIDQTLCRSSEIISNVSQILKKRSVCAAGSRTSVSSLATANIEDGDTVCILCEVGTYNTLPGSHECMTVTACPNAMYWDASGIDWSVPGRTLDSNCQYEWNSTEIARGFYPRIAGDTQLVFDSPRHIRFKGLYVPCSQPTLASSSVKCGSVAIFDVGRNQSHVCVHDFVSAWKAGLRTVSKTPNPLCFYGCASNHYLSGGLCTRCANGKFKDETMTETQSCSLCAAGTSMTNLVVAKCQQCPAGKFSSPDRTECREACQTSMVYAAGHYCTRSVRSYLIILPTELQTHRVNVEACAGEETFSQNIYKGFGEQFCRVSEDCDEQKIWNNGACVACGTVQHSTKFTFNCFPSCVSNFFAVRNSDSVVTITPTRPYFCKPCEASLAVFKSQQCGTAFYLSETCTVANTINQCVPCTARTFQEHDASKVPEGAFRQAERCIFKCREAEIVMGNVWYYLSVFEIAKMMGLSVEQIRQKVSGAVAVECIRTQVHSKYNCLDDNLELILDFRGTYGELVPWPTARCREGAQRSCTQKNGVEIRVNDLEERFECHCKTGFYGTYANVAGSATMVQCNFCPTYGDSIKATTDIRGCFCRPGTFRDENASLALNGGTGLVCLPCDSDTMYCPGGPHNQQIFNFVLQSVARQQALLVYNTQSALGKRLPCPGNTTTRHRFANSVASCITSNDMRYDVAAGYYVFCDDDRHSSSSNVTQWLEPKSQPCNRRCYPPLSIADAATHNCRCNVAKGYELKRLPDATHGLRRERAVCECLPGWYQHTDKIECIPCPKNSYCNGQTRTPCDVQYTSPMFSRNETACMCPPGFSFKQASNACALCQITKKCPGGRSESSSITCLPEEICVVPGTYIPVACPRGSTKKNMNSRNSPNYAKCESAAIVTAPVINMTLGTPELGKLFVNEVQKFTTDSVIIYQVENPNLVDLCADSTFQINTDRVLRQQT